MPFWTAYFSASMNAFDRTLATPPQQASITRSCCSVRSPAKNGDANNGFIDDTIEEDVIVVAPLSIAGSRIRPLQSEDDSAICSTRAWLSETHFWPFSISVSS